MKCDFLIGATVIPTFNQATDQPTNEWTEKHTYRDERTELSLSKFNIKNEQVRIKFSHRNLKK